MTPPEVTLSSALIRAVCLLVPVVVAFGLLVWRSPGPRALGALLLALLWNVAGLVGLNALAVRFGLWSFGAQGGLFLGVPVDLLLGWAVLWGPLPLLAFPGASLWVVLLALALVDAAFMPRLEPVVRLGGGWLLGEALGLLAVAWPAQLMGRWTRDRVRLGGRVALQVLLFAALYLGLVTAMAIEQSGFAAPGLTRPAWWFALWAALMLPPGLMAVVAVLEFWRRGRGTPFPWDAPERLVTTGPYRFVANPMQLGAATLAALWGLMLEHWWVVLAGPMSLLFSVSLAAWSEGADLKGRFGADWLGYRQRVRDWWPRWHPHVGTTARFSGSARWGAWLQARQPVGLEIAEGAGGFRYECDGHAETGLAALGRAFEHLHLGWACAGWALRLLAAPFNRAA